MLNQIDSILNQISMYRLVLYFLLSLIALATTLSFFNLLPYSVVSILLSTAFLVATCWSSNMVFSKLFKVPVATESSHISALILALILAPAVGLPDYGFLAWAALWTSASKYVFSLKGKHLFNPAAFGVWIAGIGIGTSATWWVGSQYLTPLVLVGGLLVIRKIKRLDLALSFIFIALGTVTVFTILNGGSLLPSLQKTLLSTPLFFLAFVMLTEPLTTPPTNKLQIAYGALTGFLFAPEFHIGSWFTTPESALLFGNIFSYLVSPKEKLVLKLKARIKQTPSVWDLIFDKPKNFTFKPGQYMEWTVTHKLPDSRGNRRYFTIASSPTE